MLKGGGSASAKNASLRMYSGHVQLGGLKTHNILEELYIWLGLGKSQDSQEELGRRPARLTWPREFPRAMAHYHK